MDGRSLSSLSLFIFFSFFFNVIFLVTCEFERYEEGADPYLDGREVRLRVEILPNPTPIWCGSNLRKEALGPIYTLNATYILPAHEAVKNTRLFYSQCFQKHCDKN